MFGLSPSTEGSKELMAPMLVLDAPSSRSSIGDRRCHRYLTYICYWLLYFIP